MKKVLPFLAGLLVIAPVLLAQPLSDRWFTQPVTSEDGDSIRTFQVSVSSSQPTQIVAASTTRSVRTRTITNTNANYTVYIGTAAAGTGLSSYGYALSVSTGTNATYRTKNTSAIYGLSGGAAAATVTVIEEYNSVP